MCKARGVLSCPTCKRKLEVTRPDSLHPLYSLENPRENEVEGDIIEQVYECRNPECKAKITVYWYGDTLFSDKA